MSYKGIFLCLKFKVRVEHFDFRDCSEIIFLILKLSTFDAPKCKRKKIAVNKINTGPSPIMRMMGTGPP